MITKIARILGIVTIVLFSSASVFIALAVREMGDEDFKRILAYPSFFEDRFYDFRMRENLDHSQVSKDQVLVKIDEHSLEKLGRWPFTRRHWAKFLDKMTVYGAKVVAFDVFFVEPEIACNEVSPDKELADAIRRFQTDAGRKVILPYSMNIHGELTAREFKEIPEALYDNIMDAHLEPEAGLKKMTVSRDAWPLALLAETGAPLGHIEATADPDGIFRMYHLVSNADDLYLPSLGLAVHEAFYLIGGNEEANKLNKPKLKVQADGSALLQLKNGQVPVSASGQTKVRWFGGTSAFKDASLSDVIDAKDDDQKMHELFKDKIVYVGSTAYGAHDLRHTPIDPAMPGVYFHMHLTHMLNSGTFFKQAADSTTYSWAILLLGTLVMIVIQLLGKPILDLFVVLALTLGIYLYDLNFLTPQGYEIKLFFCLFSIIACYMWNTFLNFYLSNKDKAFLKNAFGNYISPELIDEMYKSGEPPKLGGTEDVITAYFTDIAGFSSFSEKLTATKLVELLNEYLTHMTDILLEEKGTLDKYEGDAIIAFFGAPMPVPDHAQRACRVASKMQERLAELRVKWTNEGDRWPTIVHDMRMRIGINSGSIVTGNMGSTQRMNYTMMGDSVNLAARLEAAAKQYGIFTQISQFTKNLLVDPDEFLIRELDVIRVVGKSEPVTVYEIMCFRAKADENLLQLQTLFAQGREAYKIQKWDEAIGFFKQSLECEYIRFPELKGKKPNPSEIYLERCEEFKKLPPPPDWDGVSSLNEK